MEHDFNSSIASVMDFDLRMNETISPYISGNSFGSFDFELSLCGTGVSGTDFELTDKPVSDTRSATIISQYAASPSIHGTSPSIAPLNDPGSWNLSVTGDLFPENPAQATQKFPEPIRKQPSRRSKENRLSYFPVESDSLSSGPTQGSVGGNTSRIASVSYTPKTRKQVRKPLPNTQSEKAKLELNKRAASRLRQRTKAKNNALEDRKAEVNRQHDILWAEYEKLVDQVVALKQQLFLHSGCNDDKINQWIRHEMARHGKQCLKTRTKSDS